MLNHAIPVVIATMVIGLVTAVTLYLKHYRVARVMIILETAFLLGSWGLSQIPYLIPPDVTIDNAANAPNVILTLLTATAIGMVILLPSLYFLFSVFKLPYPVPGLSKEAREQAERNREHRTTENANDTQKSATSHDAAAPKPQARLLRSMKR